MKQQGEDVKAYVWKQIRAVLLFTRDFEDESELKVWAKKFPYDVFYEGTNGKERRIG